MSFFKSANNTYVDTVNNHTNKLSDKWSGYLKIYNDIFSQYRNSPVSILEIGIQNGGSLECELEYFKQAKNIIGCDINKECANLNFNSDIIRVVIGDANSSDTKTKILAECDAYDIIIDDGSHTSSDIIKSFVHYYPYLKVGGVYIVEDLHCSYWQEFEGGLYDEHSSQSFLKILADVINFEHWGIQKSREEFINGFFPNTMPQGSEDWLSTIYSIQFLNSICVIRKSVSSEVGIGVRVIVGRDELITKDSHQYAGTGPITYPQHLNPKSRDNHNQPYFYSLFEKIFSFFKS
jgi:hypothetical protein